MIIFFCRHLRLFKKKHDCFFLLTVSWTVGLLPFWYIAEKETCLLLGYDFFLDCGIEGAVHMSRLEKRLTTLFGLLLSPLYLLEERERNERMQERINRLARKTSNFESWIILLFLSPILVSQPRKIILEVLSSLTHQLQRIKRLFAKSC